MGTEARNPFLPEIYAEEAGKFTAMANRVAPPDLVAKFLIEKSKIFPPVLPLDVLACSDAFAGVWGSTEFHGPQKDNLGIGGFPVQVSKNYFEFCRRDPSLMLAALYLMAGFQEYFRELKANISDAVVKREAADLGRHFTSRNLVQALPVALCQALIEREGNSAGADVVDRAIIQTALTALEQRGQFVLRARELARRGTPGRIVEMRCPMEGYLFKLLVGQSPLQAIIQGIGRMNDASKRGMKELDADPEMSSVLITHMANTEVVKRCASMVCGRWP